MVKSSKTNIRICVIVLSAFSLLNFNFAAGDELNLNSESSLNLNPLDNINKAGIKSIGAGDTLERFKFNLPLNFNKINIDTNIPISPKFNESQDLPDINLRQFLTPRDISSDDFVGAVKAVVTLVIEIFLLVISITSQILKLILGFLR